VLSRGGAQAGYLGAGVIQAIEEARLRPGLLSGVSAGAINACALGVGMDAETRADLWIRARWQHLFRPRLDLWRLFNMGALLRRPTTNLVEHTLDAVGWTWLLDPAPARRNLARLLGGGSLPVRDDITLVISAVDQSSAEVVRFTNTLPPPHRCGPEFREVELHIDHLVASTAFPCCSRPPGSTAASTSTRGSWRTPRSSPSWRTNRTR